MLKIWSMVNFHQRSQPTQARTAWHRAALADNPVQKQQQQKDANAESAGPKKKKVTAAQLRVQKGRLSMKESSSAAFTQANAAFRSRRT